jgi:hypothetical protein
MNARPASAVAAPLRNAWPVLRTWAAAAFVGFGVVQLFGLLSVGIPVHGDATFGLHAWADVAVLGGGLLLLARLTAPFALVALAPALPAAATTTYRIGLPHGWWAFGALGVILGAGLVHFAAARAVARRKAVWDAVAEQEMARHLLAGTRRPARPVPIYRSPR